MAWFPVALAAFFLFAVAVVVDKLMLTRTAIVPLAYAFSICLMSAAASLVLYLPILIGEGRVFLPGGFALGTVAASGVAQFFGLLCMFEAVRRGEVSKASPMIVSLQPVASLLLTLILPPLVHLLAPHQVLGLRMVASRRLIGVALIIAGSYLLSQAGEKKTAFGPGTWLYVGLAGFLLAAANVFADISYTVFDRAYLPPQAGPGENELMFAKAFLWTRWMSLAGGLVYVVLTGSFSRLLRGADRAGQPARGAASGRPEGGPRRIRRHWVVLLFLLGQGCGALAVVLQQYAIKLGNVVAVTALGGVQFFFVIALSVVLSRVFPQLLSEGSSRGALLQKALWSVLLFGGVVLLAV
jgi:drug/metabolite transporter (DMT)-like permease